MSRFISRTKEYSSKFVNVFKTVYEDHFGDNKEWWNVSRRDTNIPVSKLPSDHVDAVVVFAVHRNNYDPLKTGNDPKLVVIRQYRPSVDSYVYELPAGIMDVPGEDIFEAGIREFIEETGLDVLYEDMLEPFKFVQTRIASSVGLTDELSTIISIACTGTPKAHQAESDAGIDVLLMSEVDIGDLFRDKNAIVSPTLLTAMVCFSDLMGKSRE